MNDRTDNELSHSSSPVGVNTSPLVSVVIPVFNGEKTLQGCLNALVSQEFPKEHYEVIVVDNGSTDGTWAIIQGYGSRVRGLQELRVQSSYAARNAGICASRGKLIVFTDADCIPDSRWLGLLVENFNTPTLGCVAGDVLPLNIITPAEKYAAQTGILRQRRTLKHPYRPYAQTANVAYRREVFEQIGLFNGSLESGGDADFCWRMQEQTNWALDYNEAAIVLHHHRASSKALWKQFTRYGHGISDLQLLYAGFRPPSRWGASGCLRKLLKLGKCAVEYLVGGLVLRRHHGTAREKLQFAFYDFVQSAAFVVGTLRGSRKVKKNLEFLAERYQ